VCVCVCERERERERGREREREEEGNFFLQKNLLMKKKLIFCEVTRPFSMREKFSVMVRDEVKKSNYLSISKNIHPR